MVAVELSLVVGCYRFAYLATVGEGRRAHLVAVHPVLDGAVFRIPVPGPTSGRNVVEEPEVTLVWPPSEVDDYSLIVDGTGAFEGNELVVTPLRAVLHRPSANPAATPSEPDVCGSDCIELTLSESDVS
jgi:hypothetical protein